MGVCVQFYKKGSNEPEKLSAVDNAICAHFGVEPDPKLWYQYWFDTVGFFLACGKDYDWIVREYPERQALCKFLAENYEISNWRE